MRNYFFDDHKVRYELVATHEGKPFNWLFIPGGPGTDSSYYHALTDNLRLPGNTWFIDFPGNGDNVEGVPPDYDFDQWFDIFLPTITRFENPIIVGHSFSGMFPLLFPKLENSLKGIVILHSAPSLWLEAADLFAKQHNLPDLSKELGAFVKDPNQKSLDALLNAALPYYFPERTLDIGRELLANLTIRFKPAVWWQKKVIEINYSAKWIPQKVPTLVLGGECDAMCPFFLFQQDERFKRDNIRMVCVEGAGHFGWTENLEDFKTAFRDFVSLL